MIHTHTHTVSEVLSEASTCTIHLQVKHGKTKLLKTKDSHCQATKCSEWASMNEVNLLCNFGECSCKTVSLEHSQINMLWKINQGELLGRFEEYEEDSP